LDGAIAIVNLLLAIEKYRHQVFTTARLLLQQIILHHI